MSLIASELEEVWQALRASSPQRDDALLEVRIKNFRGIRDLRVPFSYPVCVLAGPNGCGKSTVLFTCACAYRVPDRGPREFVPSSLFPNFKDRRKGGSLSDATAQTELEFYYLHKNERISMAWKRGKSWNRSYMGRKGGDQPERSIYLRTLSNLTNPSEVRGFLQKIGRNEYQTDQLNPGLLFFAHRILRYRYRNLSLIISQKRDLLFAEVDSENDTRYSEFHMSSGERAIIRMSKDISQMQDALILIDEVDTGLHPYTQQQVMLELQRVALRQRLQIIVASHSPVILDSVPPEARIFLERDDETAEVRLMPAYRDIFQRSLYGQSRDQLSILCEDAVAEGIVRGILDVLNTKIGLRHEDFIIGRNAGKEEFPAHVRALGKFSKLNNFLFVLDGDAREMDSSIRTVASEYKSSVEPLFLPGNTSPEYWIWEALRLRCEEYATSLGLQPEDMRRRMSDINQMLLGDIRQRDVAKSGLDALASEVNQTPSEIARIVGRRETEERENELADFLIPFKEQINKWRQF